MYSGSKVIDSTKLAVASAPSGRVKRKHGSPNHARWGIGPLCKYQGSPYDSLAQQKAPLFISQKKWRQPKTKFSHGPAKDLLRPHLDPQGTTAGSEQRHVCPVTLSGTLLGIKWTTQKALRETSIAQNEPTDWLTFSKERDWQVVHLNRCLVHHQLAPSLCCICLNFEPKPPHSITCRPPTPESRPNLPTPPLRRPDGQPPREAEA